ncbi:MAG: aminotransferase class III-fold pyridoxal phosphate-dependent enzyme [Coprococcus sp.]
MKVSESGYTREELLEIVDTYLAEQSRRWEFIEEKGDGMYVYAENGDRYLDFFAGIAVSSAGNANKKVAKAIATGGNVIHASNYAYTLPMILLARRCVTRWNGEDSIPELRNRGK